MSELSDLDEINLKPDLSAWACRSLRNDSVKRLLVKRRIPSWLRQLRSARGGKAAAQTKKIKGAAP
jgi:hypothetical protein